MIRAALAFFFIFVAVHSEGADWPAVARVEIKLTTAGVAKLRADPREYVPAVVTTLGRTWPHAGVHLKGTGTFQPIDEKPSFTIDLSRFDEARARDRIHLNNSAQDASYLKEFIGAQLFRAAGIPAPKVAHALVTLNGHALGFYVLKEAFTHDFLTRAGLSGTIYETRKTHDITGDLKPSPGENLDALKRALDEPGEQPRWAALTNAVEIDQFITFMAMEVIAGHWDGYSLGMNNFRLLQKPSGQVTLLPSGMDQLFGNPELPWLPDMTGVLARAVMSTREGRVRYEATFRRLLTSILKPHEINVLLDNKLADLRPALPASFYNEIVAETELLKDRIARREQSLHAQLRATAEHNLAFTRGLVPITSWTLADGHGAQENGVLRLDAGNREPASWRTSATLPPGTYLLRASIKTTDGIALPFGKSHGAALRIHGGEARSEAVLGSTDWREITLPFTVESERNVMLICELRAESGQAWFREITLDRSGSGTGSAKFSASSVNSGSQTAK